LRQRAEEQAADVSQNGSTARGDAVLGQKLVEVAEGIVDALGGLEALGIPDERSVDVGTLFLFFHGEMVRAEAGVRGRGEAAALAAIGIVMGTALREWDGV